ncbi:MAG: class I SAM-dependent methyltransferase [Ginsengibacter sp.]
MKSEHATFSGSIPANYDRYLGPLFFEPYALDIVSRIKEGNIQRVLEIACGTGRVTMHLRKAIPSSAELIATDLNPGMIEVAYQLLTGENIKFQAADAQALPFDDNTFDLIVCQFGFMFMPDKPKAFNEAFRVLKQGGKLIFNTWDKIENNPLSNTVKNIVAEYLPATSAGDFYKVPFSMFDKEAIKLLLQDAGFGKIIIELVKKEGITSTSSDGVKGMILGTPAFKEISDIDVSAPEKIIGIAEKKIAELYGNNPSKSELNAWVAEAWK